MSFIAKTEIWYLIFNPAAATLNTRMLNLQHCRSFDSIVKTAKPHWIGYGLRGMFLQPLLFSPPALSINRYCPEYQVDYFPFDGKPSISILQVLVRCSDIALPYSNDVDLFLSPKSHCIYRPA